MAEAVRRKVPIGCGDFRKSRSCIGAVASKLSASSHGPSLPDRSTALETFRTVRSGHSRGSISIAVTVNLTALDETQPTQEMAATKAEPAEPTGQKSRRRRR